ncbi:MAG: DUF5343 domain-containing protein [Paracoccaceae bacterium]
MSESTKKLSAPYATYGSFVKFINDLKESGIPPRIDKTVFKTTSGSVIYSVMPALKFLNLIDDDGAPTSKLQALVEASDAERPSVLKDVIKVGYNFLFEVGFDVSLVSAGQFNDRMKKEFEVPSSSIDKMATFFIAACKDAKIELSTHLTSRKPLAASSNSKKSKKQRVEPPAEKPGNPAGEAPLAPISEKALEYRLVDLMSEAVTDPDVMQAIVTIITFLKTKDASKKAAGHQKEDN